MTDGGLHTEKHTPHLKKISFMSNRKVEL